MSTEPKNAETPQEEPGDPLLSASTSLHYPRWHDPINRRAFYISLMAGVVLAVFIEPLLNKLWQFILWFAPYVRDSWVDQAFVQAALMLDHTPDTTMLLVVLLISAVGLIMFSTVVIVELLDYRVATAISFQHAIWKEKEEVIEEIVAEEKEYWKSLNKSRMSKTPSFSIGIAIITLLFMMITFAFASMEQAKNSYVASFNQRLHILTPVISEQDRVELIASWASMVDRDAYKGIVASMDSLAASNRIVLPEAY